MHTQSIHRSALVIPQGMKPLRIDQSDAIQGGKRREESLTGRVIIGMIANMIVPGGFIIAFF